MTKPEIDLSIELGRLKLANPILVASGTFGYAREMRPFVDCSRLGGVVPKTVTRFPRAGNPPPRTVETASGMLNSIGLDNDGIEEFLRKHLPYLATLETAVIVNIAGKDAAEFVEMARMLEGHSQIAAIELNISCPNVACGTDFGVDPAKTFEVVSGVRNVTELPVLAKLTPNVTDIVPIARAALDAGADAVTLINTIQGMAVDWKKRKPILGRVLGGLSGPAIKPVALRIVHQVRQAIPDLPIIGVGGISNLGDVMEFLVTGASAVQIGTATFFDPTIGNRLPGELHRTLQETGEQSVRKIIGSLKIG